jgi:hypothetical protein
MKELPEPHSRDPWRRFSDRPGRESIVAGGVTMKQLPRRCVLAWALVCAACGGASTRSSAPEAGEPDPGREFCLHYSNPGGMWLPLQLQRPLHVDTLRRMGVRLDAAALSDPRGGSLRSATRSRTKYARCPFGSHSFGDGGIRYVWSGVYGR